MSECVVAETGKATIYHCGVFGAQTDEVAEVKVVVVSRGAGDELIVRFRKPRARKWEGWRASEPRASFVVVRDWEAPKAPSGLTREGSIEKSKYASYDPRYRQEFDAFVDRELVGTDRLVGDYRAMTAEKVAALRAEGERKAS